MVTFSGSDDLTGAVFTGVSLRGARFVESDLSGIVMRGVELSKVDIDAPWLPDTGPLLINGVDVTGYVEDELDRRFPGRALRRASDPEGLRTAWASLQRTWADTVARAAAMPPGTVDVSVAGEWSFSQTLRHLVLATDLWLGRAVLARDDPFHPLGLRHDTTDDQPAPPYADVMDARADRVAMVGDLLARVTVDDLAVARENPHDPAHPETTLSCLHVVLEEEWEHHRFAVRDLDALEASATS